MKKFMFVSMMVFCCFIAACASRVVYVQGNGQQQGEDRVLAQEEVVDTPCFTPDDNQDFYAATGIVKVSQNQRGRGFAAALKLAQGICAQKLKHAVEGLTVDYSNEYGTDRGSDIAGKVESEYIHIIDDMLNKTGQNCQKQDKYLDKNGRMSLYVGIVIPTNKALEAMDQAINNVVSKEEKDYIDFKEHEFRKMAEEKLKNYRKGTAEEQQKYAKEHTQTVD